MTKEQIIKALAPYPDNMDIFMAVRKTEFAYGLVNRVRSEEISFSEDSDFDKEKVLAKDTVIIIDEE